MLKNVLFPMKLTPTKSRRLFINHESQTELNVHRMVSADVFRSNVKKFSPYNTVEPDSADKDFYQDDECASGTITSALVDNNSNLQVFVLVFSLNEAKGGFVGINF